jgi:xanthine dehydrogenase accessory factor
MGARQVFQSLDRTKTVSLPESDALDIDTTEDLARATGALSV